MTHFKDRYSLFEYSEEERTQLRRTLMFPHLPSFKEGWIPPQAEDGVVTMTIILSSQPHHLSTSPAHYFPRSPPHC
jgi:hypothetical protein